MAGRDLVSAHRSILRYVSTVLPAPWDVQPMRREPQTRPLAVVQPLPSLQSGGTAYLRDYQIPFEVLAYPVGAEGDPWTAARLAQACLQTILRALDSGHGTGRDRGYSMRVPFYDYSDVAEGQDVPDDREPFDYLSLSALDGSARQDPDRDDLYTVLIDFRAAWSDDGDLSRYQGVTIEDIGLTGPVLP